MHAAATLMEVKIRHFELQLEVQALWCQRKIETPKRKQMTFSLLIKAVRDMERGKCGSSTTRYSRTDSSSPDSSDIEHLESLNDEVTSREPEVINQLQLKCRKSIHEFLESNGKKFLLRTSVGKTPHCGRAGGTCVRINQDPDSFPTLFGALLDICEEPKLATRRLKKLS
jgi:hypothetical protein